MSTAPNIQPEQRAALRETVREAYMEIFPTDTIESKLDVLESGSYIAVTCSPTKGVEETLDMSERLAARGFKIVPHIAAKTVRDRAHLREIMARLSDMPIISIFVPGGDATEPAGDYATAVELLRDIAEFDHSFVEIGIGGHPEGRPEVDDDELLRHLLMKQDVSNYLVTQMCFDAEAVARWIREIRERGVDMPVWLGLPGVSNIATLIKTSLRIGVGDSVRYLKKNMRNVGKLLGAGAYTPDNLLYELAPYIADRNFGIAGHHLYCFNQVERTEVWRHEFLEGLT